MLTGITGFILLGYIAGLVVGAVTITDMAASPRSAWRNTGRRRRKFEAAVIASWFIFGWGAVLAGIIWFAGNARSQIRISYFGHQDTDQIESFVSWAEIEEDPIIPQAPRRIDFARTPEKPMATETLEEIDLVDPPTIGKAEIDISEEHAVQKRG